jgi:hypothetical protein
MKSCWNIGLGVAGLCFAVLAHSGESFLVQVPADYDPNAPVAPAVRRECGIEAIVGNHVFKEVSARYPESKQIKGQEAGRSERQVLLTIVSVQGLGGGSWSGAKSITIRADLVQNQKTVSTRVFNRGSRGGVFGGMSGTCQIMERIAITLGKDALFWLQTLSPGTVDVNPPPAPEKEPVDEPAKK